MQGYQRTMLAFSPMLSRWENNPHVEHHFDSTNAFLCRPPSSIYRFEISWFWLVQKVYRWGRWDDVFLSSSSSIGRSTNPMEPPIFICIRWTRLRQIEQVDRCTSRLRRHSFFLFRIVDLFTRNCRHWSESARCGWVMIREWGTSSLSSSSSLGNHQGEILIFSIPPKGNNVFLKDTIPGSDDLFSVENESPWKQSFRSSIRHHESRLECASVDIQWYQWGDSDLEYSKHVTDQSHSTDRWKRSYFVDNVE